MALMRRLLRLLQLVVVVFLILTVVLVLLYSSMFSPPALIPVAINLDRTYSGSSIGKHVLEEGIITKSTPLLSTTPGLHYSRAENSTLSPGDTKTFHASEPTLFVKQEFKAGSNPTRLIFIGDIHGCIDQFNSLLGEVQFKQGEDQVVLVGDLVAKGPSSIEVVQKARSINAWCVRGNHDDRVIRWREFLDGPAKGLTKDAISALEDSDNLPYSDFKVTEIHFDIAQQLAVDDFAFLQSFPVIMALPTPYTEWIIVHGGLDASRAVLEQNSDNCMTMRNIGPNGPSSSKDEGVAWFDIWASKMKVVSALPSSPLSSASSEIDYSKVNFNKIIYGHDAGRGLQIHEHTKGLDSRCVYGGNLTAFILPGEQLASVGCSNYVNSSNDD